MTRLPMIFCLALASSACVATTGPRARADSPIAAAPGGDPAIGAEHAESHGPGEDEHWFGSDDYLVATKAYEGAKLFGIRVAKMLEAPSGATKSDARFLIADGQELWTSHYWRTRVARDADLAIGALAFCPAAFHHRRGRMPRDKRAMRRSHWILAAITDSSDLYKGLVVVGDTECDARAVRVPIQ
jgi:hypothetical protein